MAFKRAIPPPTKEEQARQDAARDLGCICCRMEGRPRPGPGTEIHHQTSCGRQIGQWATVALCAWHHRGICEEGMTTSQMTKAFGPSLAKGSKTFFDCYGNNTEMLAFQNKLLDCLSLKPGGYFVCG